MGRALRVRDFRLLWGARTISALGSWLLVVAVPAHVLALTGSITATGFVLVAEYLPALVLGPIAGVLVDRWDRRSVMVAADAFRAAAVGALVFADDALWVVYAALLAESVGTVLFRPATQAHLPAVVGTGPALADANALTAFTDGTVRLVAPPLGAVVLAAAGFSTLVLIDVATYAVSAALVVLTAKGVPGQRFRKVSDVVVDLVEGVKALRRSDTARVLLRVSTLFLAANAALSAVLVPYGVREFGDGTHVGYLVSALGAGFLVGAWLVRFADGRLGWRWQLGIAHGATAAGFVVLFAGPAFEVALGAAALVGTAGSAALIVPQTTLQRAVPGALLGRIGAVFVTAEAAATLLGALAGPVVVAHRSAWTLAVATGIVILSGVVTGLVERSR
ncbi:hypothetical protein GCM10022243_19810 [Saccharothrix violaceirubra]|uniref:MFS family permease n=1 Tax=Saccharothrix violaceirubra TaxID=413306 RepID=A0A7W7T202_9PSEU|nr:MFS transporter [Saccharothrix violaceirubra]MBB4965114.1 MFS family permease [Saccharothrix violaceirubra]